jgi:hypothetical protein
MNELAKQALAVAVYDLGYSKDIPPTYGHHPLRHQFFWDFIKEGLGDQFEIELAAMERRGKENTSTFSSKTPQEKKE